MSIITLEDCKKVIQRYTNDDSTAIDFQILPLSDSPQGFLGEHFRLLITYKTSQNRLITSNFFLKTIPQGNPNHTEYVKSLGVFKKEAQIYKYLLNDFQKHHDKLCSAKSYVVNPESFIILEDLSLKGFSTVDHLNHEDMLQLMQTLARFHSSSIIYEEQRSFPGEPYRLIDHFKEELHETTFSPIEGQARYKWGKTTSQAVVDSMLVKSKDYQLIGEQFLHFARKQIFDYVFPSTKYRNVVCHADLWKNNIMFHGKAKQCVLVDFQLVRYTPPALDIMTALHVNCTTSYLERHMKELLQVYYDTFRGCLEKHGIDVEEVLGEKEYEKSLKVYEIASLTEAAMFATIIFIGEELAQKLADDEVAFEEFTYNNRSKYVLDEIKNNPQFEFVCGLHIQGKQLRINGKLQVPAREGFLVGGRQPTTTECPRQTGPQARVSGKEQFPPANRRWVPPSTLRHKDASSAGESRHDLVFRKVRGILNKLTPDKFKKLSDDLLRTELTSGIILKGVILLIFDKALDEPKYSSMYAQLCKRLSEEAPNFEPPDHPCTFRLLLLNKCKLEFDHRSEILEQYGTRDQSLEDEERRHLAKRKMLGNIKFIGELGKLEILSESILHRCIQELLRPRRGDDPSEDLECLCQILRTCGRILDTDKGKGLMDQYFERMAQLAENQELQPRIRFMLKDIIDLRNDNWAPRKVAVVEGPVPIHQIRPVEDDRPNFRRSDRNDRDHRGDRDSDRSSVPDLFRHPMKTRTGLDDMIMGINFSSSTTNLIPTHGFGSNGYGPGAGGGGQRDGGYRGHNNQRSGFNNFNNQRGQYKHNQNNSSNQYNNQANKDVAPRFKRNLIVSKEQNLNDLELRPAANSMFFNKPSVKTQNMMNTKTIEPPMTTTHTTVTPKPSPTPLLNKEPLPIKPVSTEKPKQAKKEKGPNKEEVLKKFASISEDYIKGESTLQQSVEGYKEHKVPDKFVKDAVLNALRTIALEKNTEEKRKFIELLAELKQQNHLSQSVIHDAFKALCHLIDECENEKEKITNALSLIFASGFSEKLITLQDVALFTEHGAYYPLFLDTLQEIKQLNGEKELGGAFNEIALLAQVPENDRTKERLAHILEEKRLTFLCPMLLLEADLGKQLLTDPNPQQFYKWIKENLETIDFNEPGFITALITVLLKYITQEASAESGGDDKAITEKEKQLLDRYQPILHAFLHEKSALQLVAIYALQVHFFSLGFPRGQLLRWFNALYDLSIVEEEAFLTWKEDITDVYPGKGQALFQVNSWLTWLQEAESEEEEGDD